MKKMLALLLAVVMVFALVACASGSKTPATEAPATETPAAADDAPAAETPAADEAPAADEVPADFKVGFITLHDENSTYDLNFINAAKEAAEALGVEYTLVTNVPEGQECYDKAA